MTTDFYPLLARLMAIAVLIFAPGLSDGQTPIEESRGVIADSVAEFSGDQGKDGWYYGYWGRSADADGKYNQNPDLLFRT